MHGYRGPHRRPPFGRRWYSRDNVLERLERYQRDLEQELADVSDLLTRLRAGGDQPQPTASV
jgi:DNA-binding transcriptional MerR regulator